MNECLRGNITDVEWTNSWDFFLQREYGNITLTSLP